MAGELSPDQRGVVEAEGDLLLLACPGSGKTRTAAARLASLIGDGKRVAACSYTNVGVNRIAAMLQRDHGLYFSPRDCNTTLHGLLLRYVVYPFAHLLGAERAIRLWHENWPEIPYQGNHAYHYQLDQFRITPGGKLHFHRAPQWAAKKKAEVMASVEKEVINRKRGFFRKLGILSTDDAMWIALRLLREQPRVAAGLAGRFDELLVDEAQDTSDLQLACLHQIRASGGLRSLVMVGDLEQSIYAYQGASAEACRALATESGLKTMTLSENHRSSQRLCNAAANFSQRDPDHAVGIHRDCEIEPELYLYPPKEPQVAIDHYRARLSEHEIENSEAAVLARSHAMRLKLGGAEVEVVVKPKPKLLGQLAAALAAGRLDRSHLGRAEGLISWGAYDCHHAELPDEDYSRVTAAARRLIGGLPQLEGDLETWILGARKTYAEALSSVTDQPAHPNTGGAISKSPKHKDFDAADVFAAPPADLVPQTVHALKGEDRAAVMVVLKKHHGNDRSNQLH